MVAEKVMGLGPIEWVDGEPIINPDSDDWERPEPYSTDIGAAWKVVEHITRGQSRYRTFRLEYLRDAWHAGWWTADLEEFDAEAEGETAAHAICLLALKGN